MSWWDSKPNNNTIGDRLAGITSKYIKSCEDATKAREELVKQTPKFIGEEFIKQAEAAAAKSATPSFSCSVGSLLKALAVNKVACVVKLGLTAFEEDEKIAGAVVERLNKDQKVTCTSSETVETTETKEEGKDPIIVARKEVLLTLAWALPVEKKN
jgi:hypothetical protein